MSRVKLSICDDPNDIAFRGTIGIVLSFGSDQENVRNLGDEENLN